MWQFINVDGKKLVTIVTADVVLIIIIEILISDKSIGAGNFDLNNDRNPTLKQTSWDKTPPKQINHAMTVFSPSQNGVLKTETE